MTRRPTVLFHCQHSLGLGHLVRALALAGALSRRFRVVLLSGGRMPAGLRPPAGVELLALPPLGMRTDGVLVSGDGRRTVERALALRERLVLDAHAAVRPDVILVELFPFGRRKFAGELLPLLTAARDSGALVVCSLRDILVRGRAQQAKHDERACALANEWFDAILVHADPRFARLEESFRPRAPLRVPVHYTGFVAPDRGRPTEGSHRGGMPPRIVVSAGGGAYGEDLLTAAVEAHRRWLAADGLAMDVIAGPFLAEPAWRALRAAARRRPGLEVRRQVPDLYGELAAAAGSVSQCGYNTALDLLRAGVPALVVPFAEAGEDEQLRRAERLARMGAVRVLRPEHLDPPRLAAEVRELRSFRPHAVDLDFDGARRSAAVLAELARDRSADMHEPLKEAVT
jgi:predicted glycosyltransferase